MNNHICQKDINELVNIKKANTQNTTILEHYIWYENQIQLWCTAYQITPYQIKTY